MLVYIQTVAPIVRVDSCFEIWILSEPIETAVPQNLKCKMASLPTLVIEVSVEVAETTLVVLGICCRSYLLQCLQLRKLLLYKYCPAGSEVQMGLSLSPYLHWMSFPGWLCAPCNIVWTKLVSMHLVAFK